jgi:hypothetical protein
VGCEVGAVVPDPEDEGAWAPEDEGPVVEVVGTSGSGLIPAALAGATAGWFPGSPVTLDEPFLVDCELGGNTL